MGLVGWACSLVVGTVTFVFLVLSLVLVLLCFESLSSSPTPVPRSFDLEMHRSFLEVCVLAPPSDPTEEPEIQRSFFQHALEKTL